MSDDTSAKQLHVALFLPYLHGGGAEFVARQWIGELDRLGHRVTAYLYHPEQPDVALPKSVAVHRLPKPASQLRHLLLPMWLHHGIDRDKPDVVLSMLTYSNVVALLVRLASRRVRTPLVISERNMPSLENADVGVRDRVTCWLARRLYRHADGVVAISHPVGGDLVSGFRVPAERLYVVPNPVHSGEKPISRARRGERSGLHLVFVGRFVPQKRPHLFLDVLEAAAASKQNVRGTMIGDGPLREEVEHRAIDTGLNVSFPGWCEPWWEAVPDADCLVLTARFEGLANVLVEAAEADIPAVASSRALGVADALVPGITGELAMTDAAADYASAALRAAGMNRDVDTHVLTRWLDHFSVGRSTANLLLALTGAVARSETT